MSNATPLPSPERDERFYLRDMPQYCERAIAYTQGLSDLPLLRDQLHTLIARSARGGSGSGRVDRPD